MPYWVYKLGPSAFMPESAFHTKDEAIAYITKERHLSASVGIPPADYKICYGPEQVFTTLEGGR